MLFIKQLVLGELLPQQVEHVLGVLYMVFVFPVSRIGSKILKDWNAGYKYTYDPTQIFCSLVLFKVSFDN